MGTELAYRCSQSVLYNRKSEKIETDIILSFFGLVMKLGPIAEWGLNMDKKNISVNPNNFETNKKGIFAAGDIVRGASLVVWAIHDGRELAKSIHQFLQSHQIEKA